MEVKLACESTADACPVWHWDVANWTIIYTKQNLFHAVTADKSWRFCPTPVLGERTERIIKADGKVEYNNCPDSRYPLRAVGTVRRALGQDFTAASKQKPVLP
ncbi:hypothetical protein OS493_009638 [Desmophyllum pertusum]|uniref:Uncharacterized protein n=1 Tax=Desmophyllum pertusum TaxID=174260 RepID=A0A9W9YTW7_9CNID|nr:hypothetical protein OS493_009638 [Desmophyllum pertusum]